MPEGAIPLGFPVLDPIGRHVGLPGTSGSSVARKLNSPSAQPGTIALLLNNLLRMIHVRVLRCDTIMRYQDSFYIRRNNMDARTVITALSNPTRTDILALVSRRPMSLSQLAAATNISVSSVFAAVSKLQTAGLVTKRRRGRKCLVRSRYSKIDLLFRDLD